MRFAAALCFLLLLVGPGVARVPFPGIDRAQLDPALKGRLLIEEMNCSACHQGGEALRAASRKSPRLAAVASRIDPHHIAAFLAAPHTVKPGTPMPDLLGGLPKKERAQAAQDLTHFLVSASKGPAFAPQAPDTVAAEQGEQLFHAVGCVACHSPRDAAGKELLADRSVPLGALDRKYSYKSLVEFLRRPHTARPSGRMPDLRLPGQEIERIAHYLLRETKVPGHLAFTLYRGKVWEGLKGDVQKERAGQVTDFDLKHFGKVHHQTAIRFYGFIQPSQPGPHTFHLHMNGGTLRINGNTVAEQEPSNRRGVKTFKGTAELQVGWNAIELVYFQTGRDPKFRFEMEGPGFPRGAIPARMLSISNQPIPPYTPWKVDAAAAARGREHFTRLGCAQCHDDLKLPQRDFAPLAKLDPAKGCLGDAPGAWPNFGLDREQKQRIAVALPKVEAMTFSPAQRIDKTLAALNCIACHERTGLGGIAPERDRYFTGSKPALGNQGRLPPPLSHVGAKLSPEWMREVLLNGGRQREYLHTRMPQFGEAQVGHLVELFDAVDELEEIEVPRIADIRESKTAGYEMMGTTGFSCIACHDFNGQAAGGAGALELIHVTKRLKKNWFHHYMRAPSRFHPTVIMPSYWPGGQSLKKELLGGSTDRQIEALWAYLSDGDRAKNPKGLSRQSNQLRVTDETVMCRGRGTAGYRGIGVGYPERISLAFDTEEMALRLLWRGEFASINHGSFRAIGRDRVSFPAGIPFHRLASLDDHWPYKGKTDYLFPQDHGYQYRGYTLDAKRRPTFLYRYGDIAVEDYFEDRLDKDGKAWFLRTLRFDAPTKQAPFYFRVAAGKELAREGEGWRVDGLRLRVAGAEVRDGEPKELLVPLSLPAGKTELNLEYRW